MRSAAKKGFEPMPEGAGEPAWAPLHAGLAVPSSVPESGLVIAMRRFGRMGLQHELGRQMQGWASTLPRRLRVALKREMSERFARVEPAANAADLTSMLRVASVATPPQVLAAMQVLPIARAATPVSVRSLADTAAPSLAPPFVSVAAPALTQLAAELTTPLAARPAAPYPELMTPHPTAASSRQPAQPSPAETAQPPVQPASLRAQRPFPRETLA